MDLQEAKRLYRASDLDTEGLSCFQITPKIANDEQLSKKQLVLVETLMQGISAEEPTEKIETFYRGMSGQFLPGKNITYTYKPFFSASKSLKDALGFLNEEDATLLKVVKPPNIKYLEISNQHTASLEMGEVLFPKGLNIKIVDWDLSDLKEGEKLLIEVKGQEFKSLSLIIES